ncbi:FecR family protein [Dongia mobilis]|uniref:FecR family protein n=2 Tax=Dongia mobilis TaxID=578943 RepID=A0A4R6WQK5_9PROT|nr:FecR family protein [Dongia mobilis]
MMNAHTHNTGRCSISISGLLALTVLSFTSPVLADGPAGAATLVVNNASAGDGQLEPGGGVNAADTIRTGAGSAALLAMADGTELALGEEAELTVLDFVGQAADSIGKFTLEVTSGAVRFATGSFAKPAYTIRTPSAVAAVRGTIFSMYVTDIGETYIAVEEGSVEIRSRRGTKFTVPAGAAMFLNTRGDVDGSLFNPLAGADLSALPRGAVPTDAIRRMDRTLLAATSVPGQPATPRALGLPAAIEAGVIKAEDLPPFATKTPAYGKSKYGTDKDRDKDGGY